LAGEAQVRPYVKALSRAISVHAMSGLIERQQNFELEALLHKRIAQKQGEPVGNFDPE
jgi:hypothetical protein